MGEKTNSEIKTEAGNIYFLQKHIASNVYLLNVPAYQKKWFNKEYDTIKKQFETTDILDYLTLENNIFGQDDRFIEWPSDNNRFIEWQRNNGFLVRYWENYILQKEKIALITDCLVCALEDCKDLEYYEIAHNINLILDCFELVYSFVSQEDKKQEAIDIF